MTPEEQVKWLERRALSAEPGEAYVAGQVLPTFMALVEVYRAGMADMKAGRYYCECEWSEDAQVYLSRCAFHTAIEKVERLDTQGTDHNPEDCHIVGCAGCPQGTDEAGAAPEYNDTNPDLDDMR